MPSKLLRLECELKSLWQAQFSCLLLNPSTSPAIKDRFFSLLSSAWEELEAGVIALDRVMDGHSRSLRSSSAHCYYQENQDQISFLLGHFQTAAASHAALGSLASWYPPSAGEEAATAAGDEFGGVGSSGPDRCSLMHRGRRRSPDQDLDSLDCDYEDVVEVPEEAARLAPVRTSSSKRNRAAEVHNLSEKRRRSRINEKMKALQSLIPNSSKTDKASMLDEAIEYLKQLQLQVQMLSMRNSLSQHPMYLSGGMQPLSSLQMGIDFGMGAESAMNTGVGMLPLNQDSPVPNSFSLPTSSHQSASVPGVISIARPPNTSFAVQSSQSHHGSFLLPASIEEILTREVMPHPQPDVRHSPKNRTDKEVNSMAVATTAQHSRGKSSSLVGVDSTEEPVLGQVRSQEVLPEEEVKETFIQQLRQ